MSQLQTFLSMRAGHEHLRCAFELSQLFVSQGGNFRIVDPGFVPGGLPLRDPGQDRFLRFTHRPAENRFGADPMAWPPLFALNNAVFSEKHSMRSRPARRQRQVDRAGIGSVS